jgi:hypothetical protein
MRRESNAWRTQFLYIGLIWVSLALGSITAAVYCYFHYDNLAYKLGGVLSSMTGAGCAAIVSFGNLRYWWSLRTKP